MLINKYHHTYSDIQNTFVLTILHIISLLYQMFRSFDCNKSVWLTEEVPTLPEHMSSRPFSSECSSFSIICFLCSIMTSIVFLFFVFLTWYCLSFFQVRLLITTLVFSYLTFGITSFYTHRILLYWKSKRLTRKRSWNHVLREGRYFLSESYRFVTVKRPEHRLIWK
jgi:hypothetical protein